MKRFIHHGITRFKSIPLPFRIGGGVVFLAAAYIWIYIVPTTIHFSYAQKETCIGWVALAPTIDRQRAGTEAFTIELKDPVKVFGVSLWSRAACVTPTHAPKEGATTLTSAPFGLPVFSKTFTVKTPPAPTAQVSSLRNAQVSAVKPLLIPMSAGDAVHTYSLKHDDKTTQCTSTAKGIKCAMSQLALEPSTPYELALYRNYKDDTPQKLETLPIRTLTAVQLVNSTIKNDTTVYDKPNDFRFTFDRPIDAVDATLQRVDGSTTKVDATFTVEGSTVIATPKKTMARSAGYQLVLNQVTGKDGGSLADPLTTSFTLSGGPKVTTVSVGASMVPQSAQIVITFDQTLKADVDSAKFVHITGVNGAVARASDNSILVTLSSAPLCAAFSLVVDKGLPSGSNDEVSSDVWKFDSRIICGSSSTIGRSVKGRSIVAYTFGSGASTILFTGGIHGSEASGTTTMQAWVTYLQANGYKIPADKKVVVVPNANPDGIAAGTRYNAHNVNLDRNFPASNWRPDIDTASGILPTGGGTAAGSEPETQALLSVSRQLRPRLEVSFHAQGRLMGANQFGDSVPIGLSYAKTVGYKSMIGSAEAEMGYSITGEYEDWIGQELGVPAILIELPSNYGNYLSSQMTALMNVLTI